MLFLVHSKYLWPPEKTPSGKVVYSKDYIPWAVAYLILANILFACGCLQLADRVVIVGDNVTLPFILGGLYFVPGAYFAYYRKWLIFDPKERKVMLKSRTSIFTEEKVYDYNDVSAEISLRVIYLSVFAVIRVFNLKVVLPHFSATIARSTSMKKLAPIAIEFVADTGIPTRGASDGA